MVVFNANFGTKVNITQLVFVSGLYSTKALEKVKNKFRMKSIKKIKIKIKIIKIFTVVDQDLYF